MASANVELLEQAATAYNGGDVEPLVALLDQDVDWRGRTRGHLWWRHTPSCHGPEEARVNFERQLEKASHHPGFAGVTLDEIRESGDRILLGATWNTDDGGVAGRFFQVVTMRGGKIVDIQGCKGRRDALQRLEASGD